MRTAKEYSLYKGDEFIGLGTLKRLSEIAGVSVKTLQSANCPSRRSRSKKEGWVLVSLE